MMRTQLRRATKRRQLRTLIRPPWEPQCICERLALDNAPEGVGGHNSLRREDWWKEAEQNGWRKLG